MSKRCPCVYLIRNRKDGRVYVGSTRRTPYQRWREHCSLARNGFPGRLYDAIRQDGEVYFTCEVLVTTDAPSLLWELEAVCITHLRATDPTIGYNERMGRLPRATRYAVPSEARAMAARRRWAHLKRCARIAEHYTEIAGK